MAVATPTMAGMTTAGPPLPSIENEDSLGMSGPMIDDGEHMDEELHHHQQQQQQQQQGSPSAAVSSPAMPVSGASARPKSPIVHGSYEKADSDEEEVMVKTEFVWADGAELDVKLSGAWNGWMPVQMYHEGGKFFFSSILSIFNPQQKCMHISLHNIHVISMSY